MYLKEMVSRYRIHISCLVKVRNFTGILRSGFRGLTADILTLLSTEAATISHKALAQTMKHPYLTGFQVVAGKY